MPCHGLFMAKKANAGSFKEGHEGLKRSHADQAAARTDALVNALTGQGVIGRDKTSCNNFCVDVVTSEQGMQLYRGNPIGARIVDNPVQAATRQGYELCIGDDDTPETYKPETPEAVAAKAPAFNSSSRRPTTDWFQHPGAHYRKVAARIDHRRHVHMDASDDGKNLSEDISKHFEDLNVTPLIKEAWCYARAANGGALLIGANDYTTDLRQPLDLRKVRSLDYLTPIEARELIPIYYYNNPRQPGGKFGLPAVYQLVPFNVGAPPPGEAQPESVIQIHESRLLVFDGVRVSRRNWGSTTGWGDNIFTRIGRALTQWDASAQGAAALMADFAQAVYKVKGLADLLGKNKNALLDKMVQVDLMRSILRAMILDADGEDFERKATPMTGFSDTMDRQASNLSAAAGQPLSLIFGQAPAGLNATGDSDIRWFYDQVASEQHQTMAPQLMKLVAIELAARGQDPSTINHSIRFKPLWQPTDQETAQARLAQAQTDQIYIVNDVVAPEEIALSRFGGDQYSYETRVDFDARAAMMAPVAPTVDAKPQPDPIPADPNAPAVDSAEGQPDDSVKPDVAK